MSKLVNCKACQKEIAKGVNKCPSCGKDQRNFLGQHKILVGIVVIVAIVIASNIGGETKPTTTSTTVASTTETAKPTPAKPTVPTEYISALATAETYATTMNMSKDAIYDQLTSSAGNKFSAKSAQYAVDNVKADWNKNALKSAETYQKEMSMSPSAIYDQLVSSAGNKFTKAEAQYAKDNLK
ncbi:Ltp family lipoprotein [Clostridium estertheticum]|uniref:Ltp family lipoprotein n=1 Tax=Clostridium estertheticum TaxID=238834 RepID=UPI00124C2BAD|nr:Ltp family lipoprotein [Clostridium estertheticum]MBZ9616766.1 Ltp family lipoprotein [Clostridium estertheticum subsp. laramiense]WAG72473.1 Ltp family lipoprotein [Clostridium estertheticum]